MLLEFASIVNPALILFSTVAFFFFSLSFSQLFLQRFSLQSKLPKGRKKEEEAAAEKEKEWKMEEE